MKNLALCLLALVLSLTAAARSERNLIKCLGLEEKQFHQKKKTGPIYELNQKLISEMVQIPRAELKPVHYQTACFENNKSPSLKFLEISITEGENIFEILVPRNDPQYEITLGMIKDFSEAAIEIFINLLGQIQSLAPTPHCLKEEIPELENLYRDIKYLQEDVDIKKVLAGREILIFNKLHNYQDLFQKCLARTKKKLNSPSKAAPKKS